MGKEVFGLVKNEIDLDNLMQRQFLLSFKNRLSSSRSLVICKIKIFIHMSGMFSFNRSDQVR
jgi:hypothetical protein